MALPRKEGYPYFLVLKKECEEGDYEELQLIVNYIFEDT
jgi:hypothetical protein